MEDFTFIPVLAETMTSSLSDFNIIQIIGFSWYTGLIFFLVGCGDVRFPDFYTRMHAAGKGDSITMLMLSDLVRNHGGFSLGSWLVF